MRIIISFLISIVAFNSYAGVSGTNLPSPGPRPKPNSFRIVEPINSHPQIVVSIGKLEGSDLFQHGTFDGQGWIIRQYDVRDIQRTDTKELKNLFEALDRSKATRDWVPVSGFGQ